jgi:hypothetical protein
MLPNHDVFRADRVNTRQQGPGDRRGIGAVQKMASGSPT